MKKAILTGAIVGIVILALGAAGFAYAQSQVPMNAYFQDEAGETYPFGPGMMGRGGFSRGAIGPGFGQGMTGRGGYGEGDGPLHDYMAPALADAFGLSIDELEALHDSGETLWDYAQEQGMSQEEFFSTMQAARSEAFNQAVADGVITQEQADWMLDHMGGAGGFGPGMMGRGGYGEGDGLLHDYMAPALADAFGLSIDELEALHDSGETLWDYAQEQGMSQEEFFSTMQAARTEALNQAVADGVITQEQADWMLDHMGQGFGQGNGGCHGEFGTGDYGFGMRGSRGRWNNQP